MTIIVAEFETKLLAVYQTAFIVYSIIFVNLVHDVQRSKLIELEFHFFSGSRLHGATVIELTKPLQIGILA